MLPTATRSTPGSAPMRAAAGDRTRGSARGVRPYDVTGTLIASTREVSNPGDAACSARKVRSSITAPASSTNDAPIWVTANRLSRRLVAPDIRTTAARQLQTAGRRPRAAAGRRRAAPQPPAPARRQSPETRRPAARPARAPKTARHSATAPTPSAAPARRPGPRPLPHSSRLSASSVRRSAPAVARRAPIAPPTRTRAAPCAPASGWRRSNTRSRRSGSMPPSARSARVRARAVSWSRRRTASIENAALARIRLGVLALRWSPCTPSQLGARALEVWPRCQPGEHLRSSDARVR